MRLLTTLATLIMITAIAGCTSAPIMNVTDARMTAASGKALTHEQVRGAIVRAAGALGWKMADEGPNMLIGTLRFATIQRWSRFLTRPLVTASSIALVSIWTKGVNIHKNYNGWIQNLTPDINAELSSS